MLKKFSLVLILSCALVIVSSWALLSLVSAEGAVRVSPTALNFGEQEVGQTVALTVTVENTITQAITLTTTTAGSAFSEANDCSTPLLTGTTCTITTTFVVAEAGLQTGVLTVTTRPSNTVITIPLSGTGVLLESHLVLTPTTIDFGEVRVGQAETMTATVMNTGTASLTISTISLAQSSTAYRLNHSCTQLEPNTSCLIDITFQPSVATTDNLTALLQIVSDADHNPHPSLPLSGIGVLLESHLVLTPTAIDFGEVRPRR